MLEAAMNILPLLESTDRERLLKHHREGRISDQEFDDKVGHLALKGLEQSLQITTPGFSFPNLDDPDLDLSGLTTMMIGTVADSERAYEKTIQEVHQDAPELVKSIFDDWEKLRKATSAYSRVLHRRWNKRIVEKRQDLLKKAWPRMSPVRRPDFDVLRRQLRGPMYHDAIMMPYMNLVDLSSTENLLSLMHSRSTMASEHFAWSDSSQYKIAVELGVFKPATPFTTVMLLTDQKTRDTYGRLVELERNFENASDVQIALGTGFNFHLEHGLAVLRLQKKLYRFLAQCVEILLHDITLSGPKFKESLTLVQEMPARISDTERMAITLGKKHPDIISIATTILRGGTKNSPEPRACEVDKPAETIQDFGDIVLWEEIASTVAEVELARASLNIQTLDLSKRLPSRYEKSLERLLCFMTVGWKYAVRDLYRLFLGSPEFIDFFELMPVEDEGEKLYSDWVPKTSIKEYWPPLMILLADLRDLRLPNRMGALNILDEMERMMTQPSQLTKFSAEILRALSKLAAFAEIRDMLSRHQPTVQCSQDYNDMVDEDFLRLGVIDKLEDFLAKIPLVEYLGPYSAFNYPVWKKRTAQHVEQMRSAEARLDRFWCQVDAGMLMQTGKTLQQWMGGRLNSREIQRTQPSQPSVDERIQKETAIPIRSGPSSFHEDSSSAIAELPMEVRKKPRTRGTADPTRGSSTSEPDVTSQTYIEEPPAQIFRLHHRALKIIKAFYPTTTEDKEGRKMVWKDFLHAMYSRGFEIQKRHGSEWYFEPTWKRNSPITIHEPHPSHEMEFQKMRFEANRMARKYSWSNASFQAK